MHAHRRHIETHHPWRLRALRVVAVTVALAVAQTVACGTTQAQRAATPPDAAAYPAVVPSRTTEGADLAAYPAVVPSRTTDDAGLGLSAYPAVGGSGEARPASTATPYPGVADVRAAVDAGRASARAVARWPQLPIAIWMAAGALVLGWVVVRDRRAGTYSSGRRDVSIIPARGAAERPAPGTAYLQPLDLPGEPRFYALEEPGVTIGTSADGCCELVIEPQLPGAETVAPMHATIESKGRTYVLIDRSSEHGVFVNGQRVGECLLRDDCRVSIGTVRFSFVTNPESRS